VQLVAVRLGLVPFLFVAKSFLSFHSYARSDATTYSGTTTLSIIICYTSYKHEACFQTFEFVFLLAWNFPRFILFLFGRFLPVFLREHRLQVRCQILLRIRVSDEVNEMIKIVFSRFQ